MAKNIFLGRLKLCLVLARGTWIEAEARWREGESYRLISQMSQNEKKYPLGKVRVVKLKTIRKEPYAYIKLIEIPQTFNQKDADTLKLLKKLERLVSRGGSA